MALFLKILCDISKQAKFIDAGPIAGWLWLAGLGHCRLSSTDGFIHRDLVSGLVPGLKGAQKHAEALVRVGLWHVVPSGYQVNDYLEMNPSKAELAEMARIAADRKREYRARLESGDVPPLSQWDKKSQDTGTPYAGAGRAGTPAPSPSPSGTGSEVLNLEESARETTPVALAHTRPVRSFTRFNGLMSGHPRCLPAASLACERGVCVPPQVWQQWVAQLGGQTLEADAVIRLVVHSELASLNAERGPQSPIGDDPFALWRAAWAAHHGSAAQAKPAQGKGSATMESMKRAIGRIADRDATAKGGVS